MLSNLIVRSVSIIEGEECVFIPPSDKLHTVIVYIEAGIHMILVESRYVFKLYLSGHCDISPYFY